MKINLHDEKTTNFTNLKSGDVFESRGCVYMKMTGITHLQYNGIEPETITYNAVNLGTGEPVQVSEGRQVIKRECILKLFNEEEI